MGEGVRLEGGWRGWMVTTKMKMGSGPTGRLHDRARHAYHMAGGYSVTRAEEAQSSRRKGERRWARTWWRHQPAVEGVWLPHLSEDPAGAAGGAR